MSPLSVMPSGRAVWEALSRAVPRAGREGPTPRAPRSHHNWIGPAFIDSIKGQVDEQKINVGTYYHPHTLVWYLYTILICYSLHSTFGGGVVP